MKLPSEKCQRLLDIYISPRITSYEEDPKTRTLKRRRIDIKELMNKQTPIIISGQSGAGKTSLFKHIGQLLIDANKDNKETITISNKCDIPETYSMCLNLDDLRLILENCTESHICVNFGDHAAVVFVRGNIKNVIPEVRIK